MKRRQTMLFGGSIRKGDGRTTEPLFLRLLERHGCRDYQADPGVQTDCA